MNKDQEYNFDEEDSLKNSKSSRSDDNDDFHYYGDEDLYYKEEKLNKNELENIATNIKLLRIKLVKFFNTESETVKDIIKRLKPKLEFKKKTNNNKKNLQEKESKNNDVGNEIKEEEKEKKGEKFKELLDLISQLTELSHFDVYYDTYNKIVRNYEEKSILKWKYRIVNPNGEVINEYDDIFNTDTIQEWHKNVFITNIFI
jgi:hypothetical protein